MDKFIWIKCPTCSKDTPCDIRYNDHICECCGNFFATERKRKILRVYKCELAYEFPID